MTLVVSWIGVDTHGPTSAYIVSDSRISWDPQRNFDFGRKVFASKKYPEIFGYAGDVLFPSIVLAQIVESIDSEALFTTSLSCCEKNKIVYEKLRYSLKKYPEVRLSNSIQIIHISRETEFTGYPSFHAFLMIWENKRWQRKEIMIPKESALLWVLGSGGPEFNKNYNNRYQKSKNKSTSRNVFHCFVDTLLNIEDQKCGGPPQLVGIYRKPLSSGNNYGIVFNRRRYFLGMELPKKSPYNKIEWRNRKFELCDGEKRKKLVSATPQPDPLHR